MEAQEIYKSHEGKNVKRIREILGIKQDNLAIDLGLSQQAVSQLEQKESIESELLEKVAKALKVTPEAIKNFNEQAVINNINNTFHDNSLLINNQFNPIEKIVELYERLLQSEKEKIEMIRSKM